MRAAAGDPGRDDGDAVFSVSVGVFDDSSELNARPLIVKDAFVQAVKDHNPGITITKVSDLPANLLQKVVDIYNRTPPVGEPIAADAAVILWGNAGSQPMDRVLIGIFAKGCKTGSITLPIDGIPGSEGDPA